MNHNADFYKSIFLQKIYIYIFPRFESKGILEMKVFFCSCLKLHFSPSTNTKLVRCGIIASSAVMNGTAAPFIVVLCPFIGDDYTVRCPCCAIESCYRQSDGETLRERPLWKCCELGHKFLVRLDNTLLFERVAFVDGSEHPHNMQSSKKKARVGPSRTEKVSAGSFVCMGIVEPVEPMEKMKTASTALFMSPPTTASSPALVQAQVQAQVHALVKAQFQDKAQIEAQARVHAPPAAGSGGARSGHANRWDISDDDEDIDIDAALRTMIEIEAEKCFAH